MSSKTFTDNEKAEICRSYRLAKDPSKQITALAELNACSKSDITRILQDAKLLPMNDPETALPNLQNFKPIVPIGDVLDKKPKAKHTWTECEITDLIFLKAKGIPNKALAERFGVSISSVNNQVFLHKAEIDAKIFELNVEAAQNEEIDAKSELPDLMKTEPNNITTPIDDVVRFLEDFKSEFSGPIKLDSNSDIYSLGLKIGMLTSKVDDLLGRLKSSGK